MGGAIDDIFMKKIERTCNANRAWNATQAASCSELHASPHTASPDPSRLTVFLLLRASRKREPQQGVSTQGQSGVGRFCGHLLGDERLLLFCTNRGDLPQVLEAWLRSGAQSAARSVKNAGW